MITVKDIYNLREGLAEVNERELSIPVAIKLQRNTIKVNNEFDIASELRTKLIKKYKEKELANGNIKIKEDKINEYNEKIKELTNQEVKIDLEKIKLSDLGDSIKPKLLVLIEKILEEDTKNDNRNKK